MFITKCVILFHMLHILFGVGVGAVTDINENRGTYRLAINDDANTAFYLPIDEDTENLTFYNVVWNKITGEIVSMERW